MTQQLLLDSLNYDDELQQLTAKKIRREADSRAAMKDVIALGHEILMLKDTKRRIARRHNKA